MRFIDTMRALAEFMRAHDLPNPTITLEFPGTHAPHMLVDIVNTELDAMSMIADKGSRHGPMTICGVKVKLVGRMV